jgi:Mn-containing catalase
MGTKPYKLTRLCESNDHNTDLLISVGTEILQALEILSNQLDELIKKSGTSFQITGDSKIKVEDISLLIKKSELKKLGKMK